MKKLVTAALSILSIAVFATTSVNIGTAEAATLVTWQQRTNGLYLRANSAREVYTFKSHDAATDWERILVGTSGYRLYKNNYTKQCLDSNSSGYVYTNACSSSNKYQQWRLISEGGPYYKLANVATGRCLTTANEDSASTAKTGSCTSNLDMYDWY